METQERFIRLNKQQAEWRMDGPMFERFMHHVSGYFCISESENGLDVGEVQYAEIANDDLSIIGLIFGGYAPDDSNIMLAPISPASFYIAKDKEFNILICAKNQPNTRSLHLKRR